MKGSLICSLFVFGTCVFYLWFVICARQSLGVNQVNSHPLEKHLPEAELCSLER